MAYQAVGIGSSANDGTGDTLRVGIDKVNDNFVEIYTALGAGSTTALKVVTDGASAGQALIYDAGNERFQPGSVAISATISTLTFEGASADSFETTLTAVDPTADRTISLPNDSGTVVIEGGSPAGTAAASDEASSSGNVTSNNSRIRHTLTLDGTTADNAEIADVTVTSNKVTANSVILATSTAAVDILVHTVASGSFKYIIVNKSGGTLANDSTVITNFLVL
jgi:hypothetical protein|tara:strand:- start:10722 stop:11393 length:672 start_codon:yes stop_codon:yes gene_type:complete